MTLMRIASKTVSAAALALATVALGGCQSDLLTESPPNIIVVDNLYTNADGFRQALNALYARARDERGGASDNPAGALRAGLYAIGTDEAWTPYREPYTDPFNNWGSYNNSQVTSYDDVWTWLYRSINGANTIIDRAEGPGVQWTPDQKDEIVAEARLFRAWAYRHLTYLWGDVPLALHESTGSNIRTDWERAPRAQVQAQIEQDLLFAEAHLPA